MKTILENDEVCDSLSDLMDEAFNLSMDLSYETLTPDGNYFDPTKNDLPDRVWTWCDGLMYKYYQSVSTGHCSPSAMANFDIKKFEDEVIADISAFKILLAKYGKPRRLTYGEMKARGYRGKGAGYTPKEDAEFYLEFAQKNLLKAQTELKRLEALPKKKRSYDAEYNENDNIRTYERQIREESEKLAKL